MHFLTSLATSLLLLSDSDFMTHMDQTSTHTQFFWDPNLLQSPLDEKLIYGKRVLMVVHGYNNSFASAMKTMGQVKSFISPLKTKDQNSLYELMIGYIWPGTSNFLDYNKAHKNITELASRMRSHLVDLKHLDCSIDILAHSLGNRLVLEALKEPYETPLIGNFYALGPAIEAGSLDKELASACSNYQNLFVLYSHHDKILKLVYPLTSGTEALGFDSKSYLKTPSSIQLINCTKLVNGHSNYFQTSAIYQFIERSSHGLNLSPLEAHHVSLKEDGSLKAIKK